MESHSSSVWLIVHSNLSQLPHLLMHMGKFERSAGISPEVDLSEYTLHSPSQKWIRLWTPRRRHQKSKNRGTSGPKIRHVYVSTKNIFKKVSLSNSFIALDIVSYGRNTIVSSSFTRVNELLKLLKLPVLEYISPSGYCFGLVELLLWQLYKHHPRRVVENPCEGVHENFITHFIFLHD